MTLSDEIREEIVRRVRTVVEPTRVILFGSFARGDADEDSDVDLMVVVKEAESRREVAVAISKTLGEIEYGVDVLVATEEMMVKYGDVPGVIYEVAQTEGVPLYVG